MIKGSLKNILKFATIASVFVSFTYAKTIVSVDGVDVSDSIFASLKQQNPNFNYDTLPETEKQALLDELIASILTANSAKREGLDKSEEYKMASLQLLSQLWLSKQVASLSKTITVTETEAQNYYNANPNDFTVENADVRHILVQKEEQAKNLIAEIGKVPKSKTEEKIAELAKKNSMDPSKKDGGLIQQLPINNPNVAPEFAQQVRKMQVGSYTKTPVKTRYGYHIIYLKKLDKPTLQTFASVKTQLIELLKQRKIQAILQEKVRKMRDNAKITYGAGATNSTKK